MDGEDRREEEALRRSGPELLNRSWDQIRAGPGTGAGVGPAGGRAGPGRARSPPPFTAPESNFV